MWWLFLLVLVIGPYLWVQYQFGQCNLVSNQPGTGEQFATHLLEKLDLLIVQVQVAALPDHYDPILRKIVLHPKYGHQKTLSAIVIAAHEVGHALQHRLGEPGFNWHFCVARITHWIAYVSQLIFLFLLPLVWVPLVSQLLLVGLLVASVANLVLHLSALPIEWDASFGKALPILSQGGYLSSQEFNRGKRLLLAAALTYVSGAVLSVLNFRVLTMILRR